MMNTLDGCSCIYDRFKSTKMHAIYKICSHIKIFKMLL